MYAASAPLPPGWESKYDASSSRYFFINHTTKETTWNDPHTQPQQQQYYSQQQPYQQQQQQQHYQASSSLQAQPTTTYQQEIPMQAMHSSVDQQSNYGGDLTLFEEDDSSISEAEKRQLITKIRQELDLEGVEDDMIMITLSAASYNKEMCISMFNGMGFLKKGQKKETNTERPWWEVTDDVPSDSTASPSKASTTTSPSKAANKTSTTTAAKKTSTTAAAKKTSTTAAAKKTSATTAATKKTSTTTAAAKKTSTTTAAAKKTSTTGKHKAIKKPTEDITEMISSFEITFNDINDTLSSEDKKGQLFKQFASTSKSSVLSQGSTSSALQKLFSSSKSSTATASIAKISSTTSIKPTTTYNLAAKLDAVGSKSDLVNGPSCNLYSGSLVAVKGPDSRLSVRPKKNLSHGPSGLVTGPHVQAKGADKSLYVGRNVSLAKGPLHQERAI